MSHIAAAFADLEKAGKKGLIPFITAGDPDLNTTADLLVELSHAGATLVELGVPFSDPVADGEVIQRASERALRHGFGMNEVFETAASVRRRIDIPIVLFSYYNPLLRYGLKEIATASTQAGIDGVLVTDLPPEECDEFADTLRAHEVDMIFLVAPTTSDERLAKIAELANGFIYAVSRRGITGIRDDVSSEAARLVARVRRVSDLPVAVGFGISTAEQVRETWRYADAAVVGSAIVREIERASGTSDLVPHVGAFVRSLISDIK